MHKYIGRDTSTEYAEIVQGVMQQRLARIWAPLRGDVGQEIQRMREKRIQDEQKKASTSSCHADLGSSSCHADLGPQLGAVGSEKGRRGRGHRDHIPQPGTVGSGVLQCGKL